MTIDWDLVERITWHDSKYEGAWPDCDGDVGYPLQTVRASDFDAAVRELRIAHDALKEAEFALAMSYDVKSYPADGESAQDVALLAVREALARSEMKETRG